MAATNPFSYYNYDTPGDDSQYGNYQFEVLENLVNNFMQGYIGDDKLLGDVKRSNVIYWMKKGIQQISFNAPTSKKYVELSLNNNYDIILPPDYVNLVGVGWLNEATGELMPMSENPNTPIGTSHLQDDQAQILFDADGFVLEGTTALEQTGLTARKLHPTWNNWKVDTSHNANGYYNISSDYKRIHFSSEFADIPITIIYLSDGLDPADESEIKVHKFAEQALYNWTNWKLLSNKIGVPQYEKRDSKKEWTSTFMECKVQMMNFKVREIAQILKGKSTWLR